MYDDLHDIEFISRRKWKKAELFPDNTIKVEGRDLLDIRARINYLQKELTDSSSELSKVSREFIDARSRTADIEKLNDVIREKNSYLESKVLSLANDLSQKDRIILLLEENGKTLISENLELQKKISDLEKLH